MWLGNDHFADVFVCNNAVCTNGVRKFAQLIQACIECFSLKLEDLKVLRRSPDLFNNVKIGQGQLQLVIKHILFYHIWGLQPFW